MNLPALGFFEKTFSLPNGMEVGINANALAGRGNMT
jgi:hypothetical protein